MSADALAAVIEKLERTAAELRAGELEPARAAALVDECARLAAEAGAELDRAMRAPDAPPDQLRFASEAMTSAPREAG